MLQTWVRGINNQLYPFRPRLIRRFSLVLSIVLHVFAVLVFQTVFPSIWADWELRTYRVDLVRPAVEDLEEEEGIDGQTSRLKETEKSPPEKDSATISLDTKDQRYVSYAAVIKEKILTQWQYPPKARRMLMEGRLMLVFHLDRQGSLKGIEIESSSGHGLLDEEAIRAVSDASPFPPFPDHIAVKRLNIKAAFDYRLKPKR
jgi:TonB family protein